MTFSSKTTGLFYWAILLLFCACNTNQTQNGDWQIDFFDDFNVFNNKNWQDQRLWVNNEMQCYVPDNQYGTREVSEGSLKLKVVNIEKQFDCDNVDKFGNIHPPTQYVAGRIASKNKKEFIKGKWSARLKLSSNGEPEVCFQLGGFWVHKTMNHQSKSLTSMFVGH